MQDVQSGQAQSDAGVTSQARTLSLNDFKSRSVWVSQQRSFLAKTKSHYWHHYGASKPGDISWGNYYHLENWLQWLSCSRSPGKGRTRRSDKLNGSCARSTPALYLDAHYRQLLDVLNGNGALSVLALNEGLLIVQPFVIVDWFFPPCSMWYFSL